MKILFCLLLSVSVLMPVAGDCATVADLSDRMDKLEKSMKNLNKKLGNNYVGSTKRPADDKTDAAVVQAQDLEENVRQLTGDVERMTFEREEEAEKQKRIQEDNNQRFIDLENRIKEIERQLRQANEEKERAEKALKAAEKLRKDKEVAAQKAEKDKKDKIKATYGKKEAKTLYNEAFASIKKQDYKNAEKQFEAFLELHPKNSLAGNAQYWLGESYFARGQFDKAAVAFAEGFQKYRDSQKAPDNLFKLGLTMARLNKKQEACIAFKNFLTEYPKVSDSMTKRLQKEMNKLSCR